MGKKHVKGRTTGAKKTAPKKSNLKVSKVSPFSHKPANIALVASSRPAGKNRPGIIKLPGAAAQDSLMTSAVTNPCLLTGKKGRKARQKLAKASGMSIDRAPTPKQVVPASVVPETALGAQHKQRLQNAVNSLPEKKDDLFEAFHKEAVKRELTRNDRRKDSKKAIKQLKTKQAKQRTGLTAKK
uniref:Uncharacterized protein n=1 Tax=Noctiluca scintillans TaxID=2966 RepID=A0A7S0ZVR6_NOCSC|mmetsp:Transcript_21028/g.56063  ORF Transcript_21028/g.56063 Transcript_21028/m.56063 type:complete len:184 (+) Transcript_21028:86-637(+)